jgi:hypothetical protein
LPPSSPARRASHSAASTSLGRSTIEITIVGTALRPYASRASAIVSSTRTSSPAGPSGGR